METLGNIQKKYIKFCTGRQNFLIPLSCVERVAGEGDTEESLPVLNFYNLAGLPGQPGQRNHVLVIQNSGRIFGLLVHEVIGIENITGDICEIPAEIRSRENNYLLCIVHNKEKTPCFTWVLDIPALYEKVDFGDDE